MPTRYEIRTHACTHRHMHSHIDACRNAQIHMHIHTSTHAFTHPHTHARMHPRVRASAQTHPRGHASRPATSGHDRVRPGRTQSEFSHGEAAVESRGIPPPQGQPPPPVRRDRWRRAHRIGDAGRLVVRADGRGAGGRARRAPAAGVSGGPDGAAAPTSPGARQAAGQRRRPGGPGQGGGVTGPATAGDDGAGDERAGGGRLDYEV
jgi:hypothetical protein